MAPDVLHPDGNAAHIPTAGHKDLAPIAIVGFSLKFPQEATSPESFWHMLAERRCAMTEWPKDRVNIDAFYHADSNRCDTMPVRGGHFLKENLAAFDAPFFSIASAEAASMDPQQRGLLETTYRALENAGMPMERVAGSKTGVYTGSFADDHKMMMIRDLEALPRYAATGGAMTLLANRLSWFFNFSGPSVNLDTACSSSMIALDIACQGLRNGDSTMAIVAGSNTIFGIDPFLSLSNMNFLSPESRCFSFDERANGYARGEGFGVVIIKLLADAVDDGDTIRAVIRSTGSNQDGRTPGITQPSTNAQEALIRETYEKADIDPRFTRYFEAHGTGTAVGDPSEANAIGRVFGKYLSHEDPLYIGAVKSNIGHLEGASGIAGLIKTIMVLEKGIIPPNTGFNRLNPKIEADVLNLKFPLSCTPWPGAGLRRASVNSFGFGGANSHAVLEDAFNFLRLRNIVANHSTVCEPPHLEDQSPYNTISDQSSLGQGVGNVVNGDSKTNERYMNERVNRHNGEHSVNGSLHEGPTTTEYNSPLRPRLLLWSAADESGVARILKVYAKHFADLLVKSQEAENFLQNLVHTLATRRSSLAWKSYSVITSIHELQCVVESSSKPVRLTKKHGIGMIFTGQGAQYSKMGQDLLIYPVFHDFLRRCEICLQDLGCEWSLIDEILRDRELSKIDNPEYSQPICTALQIALIELLRSFNMVASAVVGHSSGEIAAAYCIGGVSLRSACKIAYFRGKYTARLSLSRPCRGAMLAIGLSEASTLPYLDQLRLRFGFSRVTVACFNSPRNVTLSGDEVQIDALKSLLDDDGVFTRKLRVNVAYHAPQMEEIAEIYRNSIENLEPGEIIGDAVAMISSVTARRILRAETTRSEYWVQNMVSPVRFSEAITRLASQSRETLTKKLSGAHQKSIVIYDLIELGPHAALQGPIKEILQTIPRGGEVTYSSLILRGPSALDTTLRVAGRFHCMGYPLNLVEVNQIENTLERKPVLLTNLPEYQFDHSQSHWCESRLSRDYRLRKVPRLDLLGTPATDWNPLEARWRKFVKVSETPWVVDHKVNGSIVYPAAGLLAMAIEGARQLALEDQLIKGYRIKEATFHKALNISNRQEGTETQLYIRTSKDVSSKDSAPSDFRICVHEDSEWAEICRGMIQVEYEDSETEVDRGTETARMSLYYKQRFEDAVKACHKSVEPKRMYEHLHDIGLDFGPAFRPLQNIAYNELGEAIAEVHTYRWVDHSEHAQPHVVHPTTLDGVAQLFSVALTKGAQDIISTTIPTRITNLWISDSGLSHPISKSIHAYTRSMFTGYRRTESNMFALDMVTGNLLITIDTLETTTVASPSTTSRTRSDERQLCHRIVWKPDINLMNSQQILSYSRAESAEVVEPIDFYQELGLLLNVFLRRTLTEIDADSVIGLSPHIRKYVTWMKRQVVELDAGRLPYGRSDWKAFSEDTRYINDLSSRIECNGAQGRLFVAVGQSLYKIIQGEVDPLELLFRGELAEDYYREVFNNVSCCKHLTVYLDALAHKRPTMKILEVGAGTGAFTAQILSSFSSKDSGTTRYARYDFTDISTSFFQKARKIFGSRYERMNFQPLDIELDPLKQGFELEAYDMLVASSVLHATRDLVATMKNIRRLLKPGGKLVMFEITRPDIVRAGFVFGLLPGWWLSTEAFREWSPCITEEQWHQVLSQSGFSGTDLIFRDYQDQSCHEMCIIVATAVEETSQMLPACRTNIVIEAGSCKQKSIAQGIKERLGSDQSQCCEIVTLQEAALAANKQETFYLCLPEVENPFIRDLDLQTYKNLQKVLSGAQGLLWVTKGGGQSQIQPDFAMVNGLARVLRSENAQLKFVTMALEDADAFKASHIELVAKVFRSTISESLDDCEPEYVEQNGILHINRLIEANDMNKDIHSKMSPKKHEVQGFGQGPPLKLTIATPGLLDSLQFIEDTDPTQPLAADEIEFEVKAVGVNFMDCLTVLGRVKKSTLGGEAAGVVTRVGSGYGGSLLPGDRVCGGMLGCFRTYSRCDARLVTKIPQELSFVEAAALPVTYVTAWHSLTELARIQKGESVLIHSASGGTGQSAIQVARYLGAEIYVTVGSDEKKRLLVDVYRVPEDHIFYSRNASFAQGIMRMTHGRGVDVVLNSLSGDLLVATWECMAPFGRFVEIGKKDIDSRARLPMFPFSRNVSFAAIDAASMSEERPALFRKSLLAVMDLVTAKKLCAAQPLHIYPVSEVEAAFRYMQGGKNTGKTVVELSRNENVLTVLSTRPAYYFPPDATYVISGGLGGLGRSAARWMVSRGARYLILLSRSGPRIEAAIALLQELRSQGVHVEAPACDVTSKDNLAAVIEQCKETMPPIKGCIQGTMVLKDGIFEHMSFEDWNIAVKSKVQGSWNLHFLLPHRMDFFICFSSVAGIIGSGGQANYAAGNTYMDALAHHRVVRGERAVSLDLGWMLAEGVVARNETLRKGFAAAGFLAAIHQKEFHALLDRSCNPTLDIQTAASCQTVVGLESPAAVRAKGMDYPHWMQRPTFRLIHQIGLYGFAQDGIDTTSGERWVDNASLFRAAASLSDASQVVADALVAKLCKALAVPRGDIDTDKPLNAYAVDSLLAVELRNWFAKEYQADVAIFEIMRASFLALGEVVASKSMIKRGESRE